MDPVKLQFINRKFFSIITITSLCSKHSEIVISKYVLFSELSLRWLKEKPAAINTLIVIEGEMLIGNVYISIRWFRSFIMIGLAIKLQISPGNACARIPKKRVSWRTRSRRRRVCFTELTTRCTCASYRHALT